MKSCNKCLEIKKLSEFYKDSNSPDKKGYTCKICSRRNNKIWRDNNREHHLKYTKEYRKKNLERLRKQNVEYVTKRYNTDKAYNIRFRMKNLFNAYKKRGGYTKKGKLQEIIGCSYEDLIAHLNNNSYGYKYGDNNIDIDHIKPLCNSSAETLNLYWHYSNLQLLPSTYNRSVKKGKIFNKTHFETWLKNRIS